MVEAVSHTPRTTGPAKPIVLSTCGLSGARLQSVGPRNSAVAAPAPVPIDVAQPDTTTPTVPAAPRRRNRSPPARYRTARLIPVEHEEVSGVGDRLVWRDRGPTAAPLDEPGETSPLDRARIAFVVPEVPVRTRRMLGRGPVVRDQMVQRPPRSVVHGEIELPDIAQPAVARLLPFVRRAGALLSSTTLQVAARHSTIRAAPRNSMPPTSRGRWGVHVRRRRRSESEPDHCVASRHPAPPRHEDPPALPSEAEGFRDDEYGPEEGRARLHHCRVRIGDRPEDWSQPIGHDETARSVRT